TGAGKHINPQLTFAKENGIEVIIGDPVDEVPGKNIVLPKDPSYVKLTDLDLSKIRKSYIRNAVKHANAEKATKEDLEYLVKETKTNIEFVKKTLDDLNVS